MKGFKRDNPSFSLCGLNCLLCPMLLGQHCDGCGIGNQSCKIARCSLEHGKIQYCYECAQYPCEKYLHIDDFDFFITHKNQKADLAKAQKIGLEAYGLELSEKREILDFLLSSCNDGRRKSFFCVAVNLLELSELRKVVEDVQRHEELSSVKERGLFVVDAFQKIAGTQNIVLKLNKKK